MTNETTPAADKPTHRLDRDEGQSDSTIWNGIDTADALAERFPDFEAVDAVFKFERTEQGNLCYFDDYECGGTNPIIRDLAEQRRLWTMVDAGGRSVLICAGFVFMNRLTHLATVEPIPQDFIYLGLTVEG